MLTLLTATVLTLAGCVPEPDTGRAPPAPLSRQEAIKALRRQDGPLAEDLHGTWVLDLPLDQRQQHARLASAATGQSGVDTPSRWVASLRERDPAHPDLARLAQLPGQLGRLRMVIDADTLTLHRDGTPQRASWSVHRATATHLILELRPEGAPTRRLEARFLGLDRLRLTSLPSDGTPTFRWKRQAP